MACDVMQNQINNQGLGGSTGASCEVMLAFEGVVACEVTQKQNNGAEAYRDLLVK